MYDGLNDPDKMKDTYKEMRKTSFYPVVTVALNDCPKALPAWKNIQDKIDSITVPDWSELERVWDHCYVECGL